MKKSIILSLAILALVIVILFVVITFINSEKQNLNNQVIDNSEVISQTENEEVPKPSPILPGIKASNFTGILEEVNVGCFADGECYVVVDGKHITVLMGRSQAVVGRVEGVGGFGDLESFVGEKVEVYAQDLGDKTYSLYGSEDFYIKLMNAGGIVAKIGETVDVLGVKVTPIEVLEDSRCPIDVQCIQAGTVRLRATLETSLGKSEQIFVLGESITTVNEIITMVKVEPITDSMTSISDSEYAFYFKLKLIK